jgi:hypothetical protein
MAGDDTKTEVHAAEEPTTRVLETDVAKIPDGAEIPHQLEVCVCGNGIVFE